MSLVINAEETGLQVCKRCAGSGRKVKGLELDICHPNKYEEQKKKYLSCLKSRQKNALTKENPLCECCNGAGLVDPNHAEACRQELKARRDVLSDDDAIKPHHGVFKENFGRWPWEKQKEKGE